jgi:hypothetical protein
MFPRLISFLLGGALIFSAFASHSTGSPVFTHDLVAGIVVALIALVSDWVPRASYANTAIATWIFVSTAAFNDVRHFHWTVLIGGALFIASLGAGAAPPCHTHMHDSMEEALHPIPRRH